MTKINLTKEQLTATVASLLSCCIAKLTDHFPDSFSTSERQGMTRGKCTDMSDYEAGIVQQTIWSIACITSQAIDDGVGEGDTDTDLGMFSEQCRLFISSNWEGYGHPYRDRMKEAMKKGAAPYREFCLNHPDTDALAERYVDIYFSHAEETTSQSV